METLDWEEHGGKCYECWVMEPCCSQPCSLTKGFSFLDGIYCLLCFYCCQLCIYSKMYATSQGESRCTIRNHCVPTFFAPILILLVGLIVCGLCWGIGYLFWLSTGYGTVLAYLGDIFVFFSGFLYFVLVIFLVGYNCYLRVVMRINTRRKFNIGESSIGFFDIFMPICCSCCDFLQILRSMHVRDWDWFKQIQQSGIHWSEDGQKFEITPRSSFPSPGINDADSLYQNL